MEFKKALTQIRWFYAIVWRYRRHFLYVVIAATFINLLSLVAPLVMMAIIDRVIVSGSLSTLYILTFVLVLALFFSTILDYIKNRLFLFTATCISSELGGKTFRHLFRLSLDYYITRPVGGIVARLGEIDKIRNFLTDWAIANSLDLLFTILFLSVMASINVELTLVMLATLPFHFIQYFAFGKRLRARLREGFDAGAAYQSRFIESLGGMETIKLCSAQGAFIRTLENYFSESLHQSFRAGSINNLSGRLSGFVSSGADVVILIYGASLIISQELTLGQLIAIRMLSGRVSGPILRFATIWEVILDVRVSIDRLGDIFGIRREPEGDRQPNINEPSRSCISAENLGFAYDNGVPVLDDVNLHVGQGEKVLIRGNSGCGKSTLVKLMSGLLTPTAGDLRLADVDVREWKRSHLRRQVTVVPQNCALFTGTIGENIALGQKETCPKRLEWAARMACSYEFIHQLPEGFDTPLVEGGNNLSGGQRQRLALARAFYLHPRLLILDEATSALDELAEQQVLTNIGKHFAKSTVVIISHRVSVEFVDRVVTLEKAA